MPTETTVTRSCDCCGKPVSTTGTGNFMIAFRHEGCVQPIPPRPVKTVYVLMVGYDSNVVGVFHSEAAATQAAGAYRDTVTSIESAPLEDA